MSFDFIFSYKEDFIEGFLITLQASLLGLLLALALGIIVATVRMSPIRLFQKAALGYVEFIRNVPLLIIIFLFYYGLPALGVDLSEFACGLLGLAIYNSAFIAEIMRAGIQSISKGQTEAAMSTGMSYVQCMRYIILPQAFRVVTPPLGNQFIHIVKGTSIFGIIAAGDLMYRADIVATTTFQVFNIYILVAILYLCLTIPLSYGVNYLEKKFSKQYGEVI